MNTIRFQSLVQSPPSLIGVAPFLSSPASEEGIDDVIDTDEQQLESLSIASSLTAPSDSEEEEEASLKAALDLLKEFEKVDVVTKVIQYYEKKGVHGSQKLFIQHRRQLDKKISSSWRHSFKCPVSGSTYYSGVPRYLLMDDPKSKELAEITNKVLGSFFVAEGFIFFSSKRNSKRSVAMAVLEGLKVAGSEFDHRILCHSANALSPPIQNPQQNLSKSEMPENILRPPDWARKLHDLGIESKTTMISFRQHLPRKENNADFDTLEPTLLSCIISIKRPIALTAVGFPEQSKRKALSSTIMLLREEISRQHENSTNKTGNLQWLDGREHVGFMSNPRKPKTAFVMPLPSWATCPITLSIASLYVYELELQALSGESLASKMMKLDSDGITRFGIVFATDLVPPVCVNENSVVFETTFQMPVPGKSTKKLQAKAMLKNRSVLHLEETDLWVERLRCMRDVNSILHDGKSYGVTAETRLHNRNSKQNDKKTRKGSDRTYMFVPLRKKSSPALEIDWYLLKQVANGETLTCRLQQGRNVIDVLEGPAIQYLWAPPLIMSISVICHLYRGFVVIDERFETWEHPVKVVSALALAVSLVLMPLCFIMFRANNTMPLETVINRFLLRADDKRKIPYELRCDRKCFTRERDSRHMHMHKRISWWKRGGGNGYVYYTKLRLCPAKSRTENKVAGSKRTRESSVKSIPVISSRIVHVFPLPRDFVYLCRAADRFMLPIERVIKLHGLRRILLQMESDALTSLHKSKPIIPEFSKLENDLLISMLAEATTVFPDTSYQRLEFLGDAVLSYFLIMRGMARNSSLKWDYYDLSSKIKFAENNNALFEAAIRLGANKYLGTKEKRWQSIYQRESSAMSYCQPKRSDRISQVLVDYKNDHSVATLTDKTLSDVVESLLAVAFISGRQRRDRGMAGYMVLGLMQKLDLPFQQTERAEAKPSMRHLARNMCISRGYSFELDKRWRKTVVELGTFLYCQHQTIDLLDDSWNRAVALVCQLCSSETIRIDLESQTSRIVLMCALLDEGRPDNQSRSQITGVGSAITREPLVSDFDGQATINNLYRVALFRDTLFHVGNSALQLFISESLFQKYPDATEGDLTMQRSCATSEDAVVYIMFSSGFHQFLFDQEAEAIRLFRKEMHDAEVIGADIWNCRGGWVLKGGIDEYRRRTAKSDSIPRYSGLAGGRLYGRKSKLPGAVTEDLSYSMKAIFGALCLSLGYDGLRYCLAPLFEELILLTADELRVEYHKTSTICREGTAPERLI